VPREVYQRHLGLIEAARNVSKAADLAAKKKRSALSNVYKAAKSDGCNVDAIKHAMELDEGNHIEAVNDAAECGYILDVMGSQLHKQFGLFANIDRPEPVSAYLAGMNAGRAGGPAEDNPYSDRPGSEEFVQWATGWAAGQSENHDSLQRASDDAQPTA
jgi:hypothetical protein